MLQEKPDYITRGFLTGRLPSGKLLFMIDFPVLVWDKPSAVCVSSIRDVSSSRYRLQRLTRNAFTRCLSSFTSYLLVIYQLFTAFTILFTSCILRLLFIYYLFTISCPAWPIVRRRFSQLFNPTLASWRSFELSRSISGPRRPSRRMMAYWQHQHLGPDSSKSLYSNVTSIRQWHP